MYSVEDRQRAVKLYFQYDGKLSVVIRELGYPDRKSLRNWVKAYQKDPTCFNQNVSKYQKYSQEQKQDAIEHYFQRGKCLRSTIRALGYPSPTLLRNWIIEAQSEKMSTCRKGSSMVVLTQQQKEQAVLAFSSKEVSSREIARRYGITPDRLYGWRKQLLGKGEPTMVRRKNNQKESVEELQEQIKQLKQERDLLEANVHRLNLEKAVLEKAAEIIKKDEGVNLENLSNREKTLVIDALRSTYKLKDLLQVFSMAKSSYCYQKAVLRAPDKYAELRTQMRAIFKESNKSYGYRRIHCIIRKKGQRVSEKIVRRIMQEDGLTVIPVKKAKYNSYKGELTPAVPNLLERDFHANAPNEKWLTDITEFHIPAGKVYLSPIIDCFDGLPVAWSVCTSPNAEMVNSMLDLAVCSLAGHEHPIIHSDRGCHYRWPGWIERMERHHLTRSMSKKGCSPDNSACEGFFGRMKNEMFYGRSWFGVSVEDFMDQVDRYMHWYSEKRIKMSLGGLSPLEYRRSLGLIA